LDKAKEEFDDTKGVARIRKSKERQYNGHKKREDKTTRSPQKNTVVISFASEMYPPPKRPLK
jgi:hypothetical protein